MFGRRRREEEAAAEAAREAERRALFAKLAERPEHICPFLGLASERTEYVDGISDEHRCFAFGDPAPISAEQQSRVCQERGYGNCPRYLRGVLVIPTEELEALRRPRAPLPEPVPATAAGSGAPPAERRRRRAPVALLLLLVLLVAGGGAATWFFLLDREPGVAVGSPTPTLTLSPTPVLTASPTPLVTPSPTTPPPSPSPEPTAVGTGPATPSPEPTPTAGDVFAFYEVSVGPEGYLLFQLDGNGAVVATRGASFGNFSFAEVEPVEGTDGNVYWVTQEGGLQGWAYTAPDSGDFRVRAVFLSSDGERRSVYLEDDQLNEFPEETPAP